jgi:hypothetical protein
MSTNSDQERQSLKNSLKNTEDLQETLKYLEYVLAYRTPFALYIATADRSDCMWIFDPGTVYRMIGGEHNYDRIRENLFPTEEEEATGIVFFIFRKVGPIYSIKVDIDMIDQIINDLYNEL